jgi:hypothetical protein
VKDAPARERLKTEEGARLDAAKLFDTELDQNDGKAPAGGLGINFA